MFENEEEITEAEAEEPEVQGTNSSNVQVEFRNLRGIYSSIKKINAATAAGYKPDIYIFAETWIEHANQPSIKEYEPIAYVRARRRKRHGRASGGISVYKHKRCFVPVRQFQLKCGANKCEHEQCKAEKNVSDMITLEIGGDEEQAGKAVLMAYYCPPNQADDRITRYFASMGTCLRWLEEQGHSTVLVLSLITI